MRKIASLIAASLCLLAFLPGAPAGAESHSSWIASGTNVPDTGWAPLHTPSRLTVVAVPLEPTAVKVPGILAAAWPQYEEAIKAVRSAITNDPSLAAALGAKGVAPDNVVGINYGPDGRVIVYVTEA